MKKVVLLFAVTGVIAITEFSFTNKEKPSPKTNITYPATAAESVWKVDQSHSSVKFAITHLVVSEVEGNFKLFDGTMVASKADFSDATINFSIDVSSIDTDNERRDEHLKSADFFEAEKFPSIKFESTSFKPLGDNKYELKGNLTLKGVTKPVTFDVKYGGMANAMGKTKAGFKAKTTIDRFDYDLKWDRATEAGGLVVSREVEITVNVEMDKQA